MTEMTLLIGDLAGYTKGTKKILNETIDVLRDFFELLSPPGLNPHADD